MQTVDLSELRKFNSAADEWWDPRGKFAILHRITRIRLRYIQDVIARHYCLENRSILTLDGLNILDVGCGGGLTTIPLAQLGASVVGIDPSIESIKAANAAILGSKLMIKFEHATAEEILQTKRHAFDVVISLDVIEHVVNPEQFCRNLIALLRPGGLIILSTINRTVKAYLFAILIAEHILQVVPKKTHDYTKFIKPSDIRQMIKGFPLVLKELKGIKPDYTLTRWMLTNDIDVNYLAYIA